MTIHYDEKGKYFTNVVTKDDVRVIIQTADHLIRGEYHIRPDERLKDELNKTKDLFIAVTDAIVYDKTGRQELYRTAFLALNRNQIVWVTPENNVESGGDPGVRK